MWNALSLDLPSPRDEIIHNYDMTSGAIRQGEYKAIVGILQLDRCMALLLQLGVVLGLYPIKAIGMLGSDMLGIASGHNCCLKP